MIIELVHDPVFLVQKSDLTTKADLQVAQDLLDTLAAHKETCVGMAANMIGESKEPVCVAGSGYGKVDPRHDGLGRGDPGAA